MRSAVMNNMSRLSRSAASHRLPSHNTSRFCPPTRQGAASTATSPSFPRASVLARHLHSDDTYHDKMTPKTLKLAQDLLAGDRLALSKSITLVESTRLDHQVQASRLLDYISRHKPPKSSTSIRLGISGPPGAGKSTFIEAFGCYVANMAGANNRVAVLAIDPSSQRNGGSVLGDKTRMTELSRHPDAYVRPSPTRGTLGGVTRTTSAALLLCEAGGYNVNLVETVGVGQSETAVDSMVDIFVLLTPPAAGDSLQGLKKGIIELCDVIVVTKADGDLLAASRRAQQEYLSALKLLTPKTDAWVPQVLSCSAVEGRGLDKVWEVIVECQNALQASGDWNTKRSGQFSHWMWMAVQDQLVERLKQHPSVVKRLSDIEHRVASGDLNPIFAADLLVRQFTGDALVDNERAKSL